jgi:hypothetical protein
MEMSKLKTLISSSVIAFALLWVIGVASVSAEELHEDTHAPPLAPLEQTITVTLGSDTATVGESVTVTVGLENPLATEVAAFRLEADYGPGCHRPHFFTKIGPISARLNGVTA